MNINILQIIAIITIAALSYWANDQLNNVPVLKNVVRVLIVVVAVLLLLQSFGMIGTNTHVHLN